jgi:hypothetical protein
MELLYHYSAIDRATIAIWTANSRYIHVSVPISDQRSCYWNDTCFISPDDDIRILNYFLAIHRADVLRWI